MKKGNKCLKNGVQGFTEGMLSVAAPLFVLLLWYVATHCGWVRASILPTPEKIFQTIADLWKSGKMAQDLSISLQRVFRGFAMGALSGIAIGSLMGFSKTVNRVLGSLVSILRPVPMLAWIPILILWLGIQEDSKTAVIFIGSFWPVLLNTIQGIQSTDQKLLEVAQILEKNRFVMVFRVYLPSALPSIFTGIRLGIGAAWTCVVGAEMIAASSGIGYMIHYARELAQPARVFAGVIHIGLIGLLIDRVLLWLQHRLLRWSFTQGK